MISVMLAISHVIMLSRMAQSSFKTLHKIGFFICTCERLRPSKSLKLAIKIER